MLKQVLGKKSALLRSLSYVAIDVELERDGNLHTGGHPSLRDVDPKMLSNMVREKRLESLAQLGGVKRLALILMTNPDNGLSGDETDLMQRTDIFGANKYTKPPAKSFLSFVLDALEF